MSAGLETGPQGAEKTASSGTRYGGFGPQAKRTVATRTVERRAIRAAQPRGQVDGQVVERAAGRMRGRLRVAGVVLIVLGVQALFVMAVFVPTRILVMRAQRTRELAYWASVHHDGPVASLDVLQGLSGGGRVYLLPMGAVTQPYGGDQVAEWLRAKYALDVRVLPALPLDRADWDAQRRQYVAERLGEQIERAHPEVVAEPNTVVIGVTDENMYLARERGELSYSARLNEHVAVVSTYGFGEHGLLERWAYGGQMARWLPAKLRRFVLKDVAVLYWHMRLNHDPSSLLQESLDPELQSDDVYVSDLDPQGTKWGEAMNSPCLYFTFRAKAGTAESGIQPVNGPALRPCERRLLTTEDESQEIVQVDLLNQVVRDARTDLYLPDSVPILFERVLRPGGTNPTEFGVSGSHNYDKFLWANSLRLLHRVGPEFMNEDLRREPWWLPVESLNTWVDTDRSGRFLTMKDHLLPHEHFDLKELHGDVETYSTCEGKVPCYLEGYRNAQGRALRIERSGKDRRLDRLTSPSGSWLTLSYDDRERLAEIHDSKGRAVRYGYNGLDQLESVTHADGQVVSYAYDGKQRLLSVSVAPDAATAPQEMLRNAYDSDGWLVRQTLAGGAVYSYVHHPVAGRGRMWLRVTTPDGHSTDVFSEGWRAALFRADAGQPAK